MDLGQFFSLFAAIVGVATVWVLVAGNSNTAGIISSFGSAFAGSIRAAEGR
ncbi:MAG TPA: hypothetical protein VFK47_11600 [Ktedonobacteraceae bacterium]|nr:hypothetical protein [Ktedonobacteraceae bacterium]